MLIVFNFAKINVDLFSVSKSDLICKWMINNDTKYISWNVFEFYHIRRIYGSHSTIVNASNS